MILEIIVIICILSGCQVNAVTKKWLPSLNFDNPANWNLKRLPCSNDVVRLPDTVYMQSNSTIKELILPLTGQIVLGNNVMLAFSDAPDPTPGCSDQGSEVQFIRNETKSWFDPLNWCQLPDSTGPDCAAEPALLETEQIPCIVELALFPSNKHYFVNVDSGLNISVGKINFAGTSYTSTSAFVDFLTNGDGKTQFVSAQGDAPSRINIQNKESCLDKSGCMCGNDHGPISERICAAFAEKCQPANCSAPFKPIGGCCDKCGAMFVLEYGHAFRLDTLNALIQEDYMLTKVIYIDVKAIVSKTYQDKIQIVLTDYKDGDDAIGMAYALKQQLEEDIKGDRKFGLSSLVLTVSEQNNVAPTAPPAQKGRLDAGGISGIVIAATVLLLLMVVLAFYVYRRRSGQPFLPFSNLLTKSSDMELGPSVSFENGVVEIDASLRGFDNPMYDSPLSKDHEPSFFQDPSKPMPGIKADTNGDTVTAFSNPVYSQDGLEDDTPI